MIEYTCAICEKEYPFEYTRLIDNQLVCSQCLWDELWRTRDPKPPVLDLINGYRAELENPYVNSIIVKDVLWMLDEIENAL
ncbi:hypothetical protein H1N72_gp43 [Lactococcus phage P596]|uniref:Uncharacterized protein n=1 Tax=Lactococcus phage P596 TaxID=2656515 RepID=A0A5Q2F6W0_9CAUD|nr:hypothetical protein H1N72_gp43 [Lactococcus phage P596]QGF21106.1 hypothetical protein [Lactococcus phage P596]